MRHQVRTYFPIHALEAEGRRLMGIIWIVGVLQGLAQSPLSAMLPYVRSGLGLTPGQMSLILASTRVASLGAVAFSLWGDRKGRRRPLIVALIVLLTASAATSAVVDGTGLAIGQSLVRLAAQAVGTLAVVIIGERLAPTLRAFGIGLYAAAGSLGAGATQLFLPLASRSEQAWRIVFLVPLVGLLLLPLILRLTEARPTHESDVEVTMRSVLVGDLSGRFWLAGACSLLAAMFPAVALNFTNERLIAEVGLTPGEAVAIALSSGTVGALGFWMGGRIADTMGRKPATLVALAAMSCGGIALFSVTSVPALFLAIAVGAFGSFAYVPAAAAHRVELFPSRVRATAGSANGYLATIGSALGLGFGSLTIDRIGLTNTMWLLVVPVAVSAGLTLLLPETLRRTPNEPANAP